jgi:hypothetical protein
MLAHTCNTPKSARGSQCHPVAGRGRRRPRRYGPSAGRGFPQPLAIGRYGEPLAIGRWGGSHPQPRQW